MIQIGTDDPERLEGSTGADTLTGRKGNDTYVIDHTGDVVVELAGEGTDLVEASVTYTLADNVENLLQTGTVETAYGNALGNRMTGNASDNRLWGYDGDDWLDGALGADKMAGGAGNDTYVVDNAGDRAYEVIDGIDAGGIDTVRASVNFTLGSGIENLILTGSAAEGRGNGQANTIIGNAADNTLWGEDGNDTLEGGEGDNTLYGGNGDDTLGLGTRYNYLYGGAGNDTYVVEESDGLAVIFEIVGGVDSGGIDTILTGTSLVMAAGVENLIMVGTGYYTVGNELGNHITGNDVDNQLSGLDGDDIIEGGLDNDVLTGGNGNDTLLGGAGDDVCIVEDSGDLVSETIGGIDTGGHDRVIAYVDYTLGDNIEDVELFGTAVEGRGNALDNYVNGQELGNRLWGYDGNDLLLGWGADDVLDGGAGDDRLLGGTGNDSLDGGAGNDTLTGGEGNDTYYIDSASDVVVEAANGGTDLVYASYNFTLGTIANIEDARLGGTGNYTLTGTAAANALYGNSGNNLLDGAAGGDTMTGGAGDDTYVVDNSADVIVELADGGTDIVRASVNYTLGANVENLVLTGTALEGRGNALDNTLTGNASKNSLYGGDGNDLLDGGAGVDSLYGGAGDDTYIVLRNSVSQLDKVSELVDGADAGGIDTVMTSAYFTLPDFVENLILIDDGVGGWGNALDNRMTGNDFSNQLLGGDGDDILEGGLGNDRLDGEGGNDTLIGGAGDDTYNVRSADDLVKEIIDGADPGGVDMIETWISYTLGAGIENLSFAVGTGGLDGRGNALDNSVYGGEGNDRMWGEDGNDTLHGNNGNDTLYGGDGDDILNGLNGNDVLDGGGGTNTLAGGVGNDTYYVNAGDTIVETATGGIDLVEVTSSFDLGSMANVEQARLGGTGDYSLTGNAAANVLYGNSGNNLIDGGVERDTLIGGAGDDTYIVDHSDDIIVEGVGGGIDTVRIATSYVISANIENIILTGLATGGFGNEVNNRITGNAQQNILGGRGGDDVLDGGANSDNMDGGIGNDTYYVDNAGDVVYENASAGTDVVYASLSYTLSNVNVEVLYLTGTGNFSGTGNASVNRLYGTAGNNVLDGKAGADTMTGGAGNDTYYVDNTGDTIVEMADQGSDIVYASASYTLSAYVQDIHLTGSGSINATGNGSVNELYGNSARNVLNGMGGADKMAGGDGDDTYYIDDAGDVIVEAAGKGHDYAFSSVSYTIGLTVYIQELTLTGSGDIDATGNNSYNVLTGNSGANRLAGLNGDDTLDGKAGNDTLIGGKGNDTYYVDSLADIVTELAGEGIDEIKAGISYVLAEGIEVENIGLYGSADIDATGNGGNNVLSGNSGNNVLTGLGGNDTYYVGNAGDTVVEASGGGYDIVYATVDYSLGATTKVEELRAVAGFDAIDLTGNSNGNILIGNNGKNVLDGGAGADTMTGGAGNDTYIFDTASDTAVETASGGTDEIQAAFSYTLTTASNIEDLRLLGSGNFNATGNALYNRLYGNAGNNRLDGKAGADRMEGGAGNDTYYADDGGDVITEAAAGGTDTAYYSASGIARANVEFTYLTGGADLTLSGGLAGMTLAGNSGNNRLSGTGTLIGGLGNDTYVVSDSGAVVNEAAGEGTDTLVTSGNYVLATGSEVEVMTLTGALASSLTGNEFANTLNGNGGNNRLDGGAGVDILEGGNGNDSYYIDNIGDQIRENSLGGADYAYVSIDYVLGNIQNVEEWILSGTGDLDLTGNAADNVLRGNSGDNVIRGGAGADIMYGGDGNDTFYVDDVDDQVHEYLDQGSDTIYASVSYTLGVHDGFIQLLALTGSDDLTATGNKWINKLRGNSGDNILDGRGGDDTLAGNGGHDTFLFRLASGADTITDYSGDTIDINAYSQGDAFGNGVTVTQVGANVKIDLGGGNMITIVDTLTAELSGHIVW